MTDMLGIARQNLGFLSGNYLSLGLDGSLNIQEVHARYTHAVTQGRVYTFCTPATGTIASSTTPILGIYNPINSGVNCSLLRTVATNISGTPSSKLQLQYITKVSNSLTISSNKEAINNATFIKGASSGSRVWTIRGTAITGTGTIQNLHTVFSMIGTSMSLVADNGSSNKYVPLTLTDYSAGEVIIAPGTYLGLVPGSDHSTWELNASLVWEEIPIAESS